MMIPLMVDFTGKRVVIFGGGPVAARKAFYFRNCDLTLISRSFSEDLYRIKAELRKKDLREVSEDEIRLLIGEAFLVIAATSRRDINDRIGSVCRKQSILFNNANGSPGDVILPAILEGKNFLIAVATYGRSPGFSRYLRSQLEPSREAFDRMIDLQERLRSELKKTASSAEERRRILGDAIADPDIWNRLKTDPETAWSLVQERYLA